MNAAIGRFLDFTRDVARIASWRGLLGLVLVGASSLVDGLGILLVVQLVGLATGGEVASFAGAGDMLARLVDHGSGALLPWAFALVAGVVLLRTLLLAWRQVIVTTLQLDYYIGKQREIVEALARAPWARLSALRHARVTHMLSGDVQRASEAAMGLIQTLVSFTLLAVQGALALAIEPRLTLLAAAFALVGLALSLPMLHAAHDVGEAVTDTQIELLNDTGQFLGALKLASSQNLQLRFARRFGEALAGVRDAELRYVRRQNRNRAFVTIVGLVVASGVVAVGIGAMAVPGATILALLLLFSRMAGPLHDLQAQMMTVVRTMPAHARISALYAELAVPDAAAGTAAKSLPLHTTPPAIRFDGVVFRYGEAEGGGGLSGLSLDIPAGSFLGIAGRSGAGKTTFADLLVGLAAPQSGRVLVGGEEAALPAHPEWRDRLAYVTQDAFLMHDTVRANLLWIRPEASAAMIERALYLSCADEVIRRLPAGLDTVVGERGSLISGGERQRLALARALLREPDLLILDEATNAIDIQTEKTILERLDGLRSGMTIVMIAHRLESLAQCSSVAVIEGGRLAAQGPFATLRAKLADLELREAHQV